MEPSDGNAEPTSGQPRRRRSRAEQRAETRTRLLDAAESLFGDHGIGEISIEQIAESAGYSRGAFYSNFDDKNAIVLALIERHQDGGMAELDELAELATDPDDFLARLFKRSHDQSMERATIAIEYVLYASRNPVGRQRVRDLNQRLLAQGARLAQQQFESFDVDLPVTADEAAKILLGLDEGFALLRLLDPDAFPPSIWGDTVILLNDALLALAEKKARAETS